MEIIVNTDASFDIPLSLGILFIAFFFFLEKHNPPGVRGAGQKRILLLKADILADVLAARIIKYASVYGTGDEDAG